jgi:hypothetical protein
MAAQVPDIKDDSLYYNYMHGVSSVRCIPISKCCSLLWLVWTEREVV